MPPPLWVKPDSLLRDGNRCTMERGMMYLTGRDIMHIDLRAGHGETPQLATAASLLPAPSSERHPTCAAVLEIREPLTGADTSTGWR